MSTRRPSENADQLRIPHAEVGRPETEDRPELPLDERLDRSAERFEDVVAGWEQLAMGRDHETCLDDMDEWLGHIRHIRHHIDRKRLGPVEFAEKQMDAAEKEERTKARHDARYNPRVMHLPPERRRQRADKNAAIHRNQVLADHGAARWYERPGNAERVHALYASINRQRMRAA